MDIKRATERLTLLADGVEPLTDEVLENDHVCNKPELIRALHVVLGELEKRPKKKAVSLPENAGKPWTNEEDEELYLMFDERLEPQFVCDHFKRTTGGIASRLVQLGKIKERDKFRQRRY